MMGKARMVATNRMIAQAEELGADAIINVRFVTTSVIGSAAELLAYGTAVKLSKPGAHGGSALIFKASLSILVDPWDQPRYHGIKLRYAYFLIKFPLDKS